MTNPPNAYDLTGKVALVTGARHGIGRAVLDLLRTRGAGIVASDLSAEVRSLESADIATLIGHVSDEGLAHRSVDLARERFDRPDIVVCHAGRPLNEPLTETAAEEHGRILQVNARGAFVTIRAAVPPMEEGSGGAVVINALLSATAAFPTQAADASSKAATAQ